jgi:hypothetical protein
VATRTTPPRSAFSLVADNAAEHDGEVELRVPPVGGKRLVHLERELARRREHEGSRLTRPRARSAAQPIDHRKSERGGLAGSGLGAAEEITARENGADRFLLDARRGFVALGRNGTEDGLGESERRERHDVY